jgi:hypothetical protein
VKRPPSNPMTAGPLRPSADAGPWQLSPRARDPLYKLSKDLVMDSLKHLSRGRGRRKVEELAFWQSSRCIFWLECMGLDPDTARAELRRRWPGLLEGSGSAKLKRMLRQSRKSQL